MTHWYFWSPVQRRRITSYVMQQEAWTLKLTVTKPTLLYFRRLSRSTEFADIRSIQVTFFLPNVGLIFIVQSCKWLYLFFYNTHFQPAVLFSARYEALTKSPLDAFILLNLYLPCVSSRLTWSSSFNKAKKNKKLVDQCLISRTCMFSQTVRLSISAHLCAHAIPYRHLL